PAVRRRPVAVVTPPASYSHRIRRPRAGAAPSQPRVDSSAPEWPVLVASGVLLGQLASGNGAVVTPGVGRAGHRPTRSGRTRRHWGGTARPAHRDTAGRVRCG